MSADIPQQLVRHVPRALAGLRLDQAMSELFDEYSRNRIQQWIRDGHVTVDGRIFRPRDRVAGGEEVCLELAAERKTCVVAQEIPLALIYEDEDLLVLNKPAGLVVHPAAGNPDGTLLNALLHRFPELSALPRGGLVHRLDKDTSGILVVARSLRAHTSLVAQLQDRSMSRIYMAVVNRVVTAGGRVDAPIGRHPVDRKRMAVVRSGKPAITHYRVVQRYRMHTALELRLESGRTHQIRVHMAHIRHPVVGDPVYGGRQRLAAEPSPRLIDVLERFRRQALHAVRLGLIHPATRKRVGWETPVPQDMEELLSALSEDAAANAN